MLEIGYGIALPEDLLSWRFVRAPGPGGQHVNTSATAVQLRCDIVAADLPPPVLARLRRLAGRRLSRDGVLVIEAHGQRSQEQNRRAALDRLLALLRAAARPPKTRRSTRVPRAERRRRLDAKLHRGRLKRARRPPRGDDAGG